MARKQKSTEPDGSGEQPASLEQSLGTLEQLVERMESGELTMEESLEAFEQGIRLTRACQQALDQAEQKVRILLEQSPEGTPEGFDQGDDNGHE